MPVPILFGARLENLVEVKAGSPMRQHREPIFKISISLEEATAFAASISCRLFEALVLVFSIFRGLPPRLPAVTAFAANFETTFFVPNTIVPVPFSRRQPG